MGQLRILSIAAKVGLDTRLPRKPPSTGNCLWDRYASGAAAGRAHAAFPRTIASKLGRIAAAGPCRVKLFHFLAAHCSAQTRGYAVTSTKSRRCPRCHAARTRLAACGRRRTSRRAGGNRCRSAQVTAQAWHAAPAVAALARPHCCAAAGRRRNSVRLGRGLWATEAEELSRLLRKTQPIREA